MGWVIWLRPGRWRQNVAALGTALARLPKCGASYPEEGTVPVGCGCGVESTVDRIFKF